MGEHGFAGMLQGFEEGGVPVEGVEVHELGAAGVGDVGGVEAAFDAAGEVPEEEGVDVAEEEVADFGAVAGSFDVVENPGDLEAGEVGGEGEAGLFAEAVLAAVCA